MGPSVLFHQPAVELAVAGRLVLVRDRARCTHTPSPIDSSSAPAPMLRRNMIEVDQLIK